MASRHGDGFTTIIMLLVYLVRGLFFFSFVCALSDPFMTQDIKGLEKIIFEFELGKPFKPFEQLMGVLPVASMDNIPVAYRVGISCPCI